MQSDYLKDIYSDVNRMDFDYKIKLLSISKKVRTEIHKHYLSIKFTCYFEELNR